MLSHCMVTVNFVAGTSSLNSAHEATLTELCLLSQRPDARIQLGLISCVRSREQNLVAADSVSYDT